MEYNITPSSTAIEIAAWAKYVLGFEDQYAVEFKSQCVDGEELFGVQSGSVDGLFHHLIALLPGIPVRGLLSKMAKAIVALKESKAIEETKTSSTKTVQQLVDESPKVRVKLLDTEWMLPLTNVGYGGTLAQGVLSWGSTTSPPFLNREDSLLALLGIAFDNWALRKDKPTIVMKATTPGSGKTRLLFEWPARVFTNTKVLDTFRQQGGDSDVQIRETFLNDLWATVHQQRMVVCQCSLELKTVPNNDLLSHIIMQSIKTRFGGCKLKYNNIDMTIDELPSPRTSAEAAEIFNHLIDENYELPKCFPYLVDGYKCTPMLLFLGDEIQALYDKMEDTDDHQLPGFKATSRKYKFDSAAVHELLLQIAGLQQQKIKCMAFVTGTLQVDLPDSLVHYNVVDVPMSALTDLQYLNDFCIGVYNCKLNRIIWPHATFIKARELDEKISFALRRNYLKCCGQPRAIADLFRSNAARKFLTHTAATPLETNGVSYTLDMIDEELFAAVVNYYGTEASPIGQLLQLDTIAVQKLLIQAALCWDVAPNSISPLDGKSYSEIANNSSLIPWKSSGLTTQYTYPFLFYGTMLYQPVGILNAAQKIQSKYFEEMKISFETLLLPMGPAMSALYDNSVKGTVFEEAIAGTIFTRFLIMTNCDCSKSVKLSELIPGTCDGALANAQVQLNGCVKTKYHLSSASSKEFEELFTGKYVSVDIGNSEFADVILPIFFNDEPGQYFLGIQAKNKQEGSTAKLFQNASKVLQNDKFFYLALLPGPKGTFQGVSAKNTKVDYQALLKKWTENHRYIQKTAHRWLSPWFVTINEIGYTILQLLSICNQKML